MAQPAHQKAPFQTFNQNHCSLLQGMTECVIVSYVPMIIYASGLRLLTHVCISLVLQLIEAAGGHDGP